MTSINVFLWSGLALAALLIYQFIAVYNQAEREAEREIKKIRQSHRMLSSNPIKKSVAIKPMNTTIARDQSGFINVGAKTDQIFGTSLEYRLPAPSKSHISKQEACVMADHDQHGCA